MEPDGEPLAVKILVEGQAGVGKTTVARWLVRLLLDAGISVAGFTTEDVRDGPRGVRD